jgi:hypothetical protein
MSGLTAEAIEARRAWIGRRTPQRRVQTAGQARRFVDATGFCFFWPIKGFEMPNLFHAIAGRVRPVPNEHADPDISKCWNWKDEALGRRLWYYGKLLGRRATLISLDYLPDFYALSPNYGGEEDYLEEYAAGLLSQEAVRIYEALRDQGPLDTVRLRRETRLASENAKTRFERGLVELQVGLKILPVGVAEAGAWHYAFNYDLVTRHYPELAAQARAITRRAARARLVTRHLDNVVAARRAELERVFGVLRWTAGEWDSTLAELSGAGRIRLRPVQGWPGEYYVSARSARARR